jgi:hypothetical protein
MLGRAMDKGFVLDATHGAMTLASWVEGASQKSARTGVKLSGRARSQISAWRCTRCGFLEHYAPAAPDRGFEAAQRKQVMLVLTIALGVALVLVGAVLVLRIGQGKRGRPVHGLPAPYVKLDDVRERAPNHSRALHTYDLGSVDHHYTKTAQVSLILHGQDPKHRLALLS